MAISHELHGKAINAALRHLHHRGYDVLEVNEDASPNIVAEDEGVIVLIDVRAATDGFPEEIGSKEARSHFETILPRYRYDQICFWVADEDRAMLKHHINIVGKDDDVVSNLEWLARYDPETLLAMIADQDRVEWLKAPYDGLIEDECAA